MVELIINGKSIELNKKGQEIKYTKQIADVFDIASVASSYSNTFTIPKLPNNTQILEGLGLVGDNSTIPYTKTKASYKKHGFDIIKDGWLNISETNDLYKASIIDGMIDFFKAIENKTLGADLDLANFQHSKDLDTIVASFENDYYTYIIADYQGKKLIKNVSDSSINVDYLIPCFNVKKLLELIFSTFGYTYESDELDDFIDNLYITYPTPPVFEITDEDTVGTFEKGNWTRVPSQVNGVYTVPAQRFWDSSSISAGEILADNWRYRIGESKGYRLNIRVESYARYQGFGVDTAEPMTIEITRNGTRVLAFMSDPLNEVEKDLDISLNAGDILEVNFFVILNRVGLAYLSEFHHNFMQFNVIKIDQGDVTPSNAFANFKITDFFKELIYRTGLTPIPDNVLRNITFLPIANRIDTSNHIDWTDKYIGRKNETYLKDDYAQRNLFKMKYNGEAFNDNDGVILVNNQNIADEKTLVTSQFYSTISGTSLFPDLDNVNTETPIFPMWTQEVGVNDLDETIINYKELNNRFYFIRKNIKTSEVGWNLKSEAIPGDETVFELPFGSAEDTLLGPLVAKNYSEYAKIFGNFRAHNIELALGLEDILSLDLTRPYYFKQEAQFYIMNKLIYQDGQRAVGEFVRINKT